MMTPETWNCWRIWNLLQKSKGITGLLNCTSLSWTKPLLHLLHSAGAALGLQGSSQLSAFLNDSTSTVKCFTFETRFTLWALTASFEGSISHNSGTLHFPYELCLHLIADCCPNAGCVNTGLGSCLAQFSILATWLKPALQTHNVCKLISLSTFVHHEEGKQITCLKVHSGNY